MKTAEKASKGIPRHIQARGNSPALGLDRKIYTFHHKDTRMSGDTIGGRYNDLHKDYDNGASQLVCPIMVSYRTLNGK